MTERPPDLTITVPGVPVPAPRQTQRDRWRVRPAVARYREYRDRIAMAVHCHDQALPEPGETDLIEIVATWQPPKSWSVRQRIEGLSRPKRTKPDPDNVAKAVLDTLWPEDAAVGDVIVRRRYGAEAGTVIRIWCVL